MKNKTKISIIMMLIPAAFAFAQEENEDFQQGQGHKRMPPPEMNLSSEQKTCLESILGKKGEGERPTRDAMEKALTTCGIDKSSFPPPPPRRHHHDEEDSQQEDLSSQSEQGTSQDANK